MRYTFAAIHLAEEARLYTVQQMTCRGQIYLWGNCEEDIAKEHEDTVL